MMCSFQDRDNLYLVMDLFSGGDLRYHICHKKRFSEEQTKFFIGCVLLGLEYIHSKNVIHRDIKPENLVCDEKGYIAITDFGVAKKNLRDNSSETSGTPGYMAPEVLCAKNHSFPVDFFAVGVMGFEFMLGVRPYLGRSRKEIKEQVLSRQARIHRVDRPKDWTQNAVNFINEMIQRKPEQRLGYHGINEVKNHPWFADFDWEELYSKNMISPFKPNIGDNFDKKYCEGCEKIGTETQERYEEYRMHEKYLSLFINYTFMCTESEDIAQIDNTNSNNANVNTNTINSCHNNNNNNNNSSSNNKINPNINKVHTSNLVKKYLNNNFVNMNNLDMNSINGLSNTMKSTNISSMNNNLKNPQYFINLSSPKFTNETFNLKASYPMSNMNINHQIGLEEEKKSSNNINNINFISNNININNINYNDLNSNIEEVNTNKIMSNDNDNANIEINNNNNNNQLYNVNHSKAPHSHNHSRAYSSKNSLTYKTYQSHKEVNSNINNINNLNINNYLSDDGNEPKASLMQKKTYTKFHSNNSIPIEQMKAISSNTNLVHSNNLMNSISMSNMNMNINPNFQSLINNHNYSNLNNNNINNKILIKTNSMLFEVNKPNEFGIKNIERKYPSLSKNSSMKSLNNNAYYLNAINSNYKNNIVNINKTGNNFNINSNSNINSQMGYNYNFNYNSNNNSSSSNKKYYTHRNQQAINQYSTNYNNNMNIYRINSNGNNSNNMSNNGRNKIVLSSNSPLSSRSSYKKTIQAPFIQMNY